MDQKLELAKIVMRNLNKFTTLAVEELGGIGDDSYLFLKSLGRRIFESTSEKLVFNFFATKNSAHCSERERYLRSRSHELSAD